MTKKIDQRKLDKATRAMLSMGALPKDYKDLERPQAGDRHCKFKMQVDRKGKGKIVEVEG